MCIIGNRKESGWRVILEGCGGVSFTTRLLIYNLHPHLVVWRATLSHINVIWILYKWKEWNEATLHNVDFGTCFSSYLTMRRVSVIAERQGVVVLKERSRFFGNMVRNLWRKRTSRLKTFSCFIVIHSDFFPSVFMPTKLLPPYLTLQLRAVSDS